MDILLMTGRGITQALNPWSKRRWAAAGSVRTQAGSSALPVLGTHPADL